MVVPSDGKKSTSDVDRQPAKTKVSFKDTNDFKSQDPGDVSSELKVSEVEQPSHEYVATRKIALSNRSTIPVYRGLLSFSILFSPR